MKSPKSLKYAVVSRRPRTVLRLFPAAFVALAVGALSAQDMMELHAHVNRAIPISPQSVDNPAEATGTFNTDQGPGAGPIGPGPGCNLLPARPQLSDRSAPRL